MCRGLMVELQLVSSQLKKFKNVFSWTFKRNSKFADNKSTYVIIFFFQALKEVLQDFRLLLVVAQLHLAHSFKVRALMHYMVLIKKRLWS